MKQKIILFIVLLIAPIHANTITLNDALAVQNVSIQTDTSFERINNIRLAFMASGFKRIDRIYELILLTHQAEIDGILIAEGRDASTLFLDMLNDLATKKRTSKEIDNLIYSVWKYNHYNDIKEILSKWNIILHYIGDKTIHAQAYKDTARMKELLGID